MNKPILKEKPRGRPPTLRRKIMFEISHKKHSQISMKQSLECKDKGKHHNYSDIADIFKLLKNKGLIERIKQKREKGERGNTQIFYGLTNKGIEYVLEQENFSDEEFWQMIFLIYDKTNNYKKITTSINELVETYIKNKLKIIESKSFYFHLLQNFHHQIPSQHHFRCIEILEWFGINGKIKIEKIYDKFSDKDNIIIENMLLEDNFLYEYKIDNKKYYELSQFGLLYVINFLKDVKKNRKSINNIITNHIHLLPQILKKWNMLRQIKDEVFLLRILTRPYFQLSHGFIDDFNIADLIKLTNVLLTMEISQREKIKNFLVNADEVFKEWKYEKNIKSSYRILDLDPIIHEKELLPIDIILQKIIQIQKERHLPMGVSIVTSFDVNDPSEKYYHYRDQLSKNIQDLISFQFYSLLKFNIQKNEWFRITNNKEFKKWYSKWTKTLIDFQEENLKSLKEKDSQLFNE